MRDYDQRFNIMLNRKTFQIEYIQQREWFSLDSYREWTQHRVMTQVEVVEITLHLESMPGGGNTLAGLA
jgi:hypothetical protein